MKLLSLTYIVLILALCAVVMIMVNIYTLGKQSAEVTCLFNAANKHAYITRKMCDPTQIGCVIEPNVQAEINNWYDEEQTNCKK